ncbi:MFS transporter [Gulosibacter molinativorax]|uniref:MFS transporter n=1 Tax=Gulosibacter molinativorax TaxID=256821 RepID=UPI000422EAB0|nr:MFS transporter [Gulosibacter molinativorax]QUY61907.1 EmrB/QacA family drug resistance transporter [Gulosibacter molinativorax]
MSTTSTTQSNRWPAFIVTIAVAVTTILDLVKVNVTIAPMEETLGLTSSQAQLIVAGYVLAFGILLVPSGRLGDIWNRKAMFIIGLVVFASASLYCALAPDATQLVIARLIQGVAAGILMPQVIGLIQNLFQGQERGQAFGIFGASIGIGTAFGPTIGGLFIGGLGAELGWRWTFGMNVPLALIILPFAIWLIPGKQKHQASKDLDLIGTLLMAGTVLFVMLPFVLTSGGEEDDPARWWFLLVAAVLGVAFVWWERRYVAAGKSPVIDFGLFRWPSYRNGVLITTLMFGMMPPLFFVLTLYQQQGLGHAAVVVGMVTIPFAFTSAISAAVSGRYTFQHATTLVLSGLVVFWIAILGIVLVVLFVGPADTPMWLAIVLGFGGIGQGLVMSANQMRAMKHVPLESAGVGGSFMQVGQRLGNAMGIAIATSIFFSIVASLPLVGGVPDPTDPNTIATYRDAASAAITFVIALGVVAIALAFMDWRIDQREKREGTA